MVSCRRTAPYTVPVFLVSGPVLGSEEAISECLLAGFDVSVFFALSRSSRDRLFAALWTGSSVPGILQASTLERAAVPSPWGCLCRSVEKGLAALVHCCRQSLHERRDCPGPSRGCGPSWPPHRQSSFGALIMSCHHLCLFTWDSPAMFALCPLSLIHLLVHCHLRETVTHD